jgi:uncharacterized protein (UPF0216 family)
MFPEDGRSRKWMELELRRLHGGLVVKRRRLAELLKEERPACETRDGDKHLFDRSVLERLASVLTPEEQRRLRLPITIHFSMEMKDQCHLDSELGARAFKVLEGIEKAYPYRNGKMWIPHSLAMDWMRRYPTVFQATFIP